MNNIKYFNHLNIFTKVAAYVIILLIAIVFSTTSGCKVRDAQVSNAPIEISASAIIVDSIHMESLDRWRGLRIYLPKGYLSHKESYPVIYMLDGQNLFEDSTSYVGEWHVDESMDSLFNEGVQPAIIIGIDNGQALRINEYSPYDMVRWGKGEGRQTMEFIVNQLKPMIDNTYRTLPGKDHTAIAGSSLGGLMSFYAISQFSETFSKAMVFSPSFWISEEVEDLIASIDKDVKIYMSTGSEEGEDMVKHMKSMSAKLRNHGLTESQLYADIVEGMGHNERFWTLEFPIAYKWIFDELP